MSLTKSPGKILNPTGWKAALLAIMILVPIGLKVYSSSPHSRNLVNKTFTIPAHSAYTGEFAYEREGKITLQITPQTKSAYFALLLTKAQMDKLKQLAQTPTANADDIQFIIKQSSDEAIEVTDKDLPVDEYVVYIENPSDQPVDFKVNINGYY